MAKKISNKKSKNYLPFLFFSSFATLAFLPNAMDAFSFPKASVIILGAIWLLLSDFKLTAKPKVDLLSAVLILFVFFLVLSAITSDYLWVSLFGVNGRSTGVLFYLSLVVILWRALRFSFSKQEKIFEYFIWIGTLALLYGLIQFAKLDPLNWNLVYEGIIGVFGNPNFMGAYSALVGVASFSMIWQSNRSQNYKIWGLALLAISVINIYASKALQGLVSLLIGIAPIVIYLAFKKSKGLGRTSVVLASIGLITFVLGLFRIGPLTDLVYKQSLSFRGDFWRTAFNMIGDNPLLGVGFDRFGVNYRQYRDVPQVLRNGVDAYSDNAHNVYLQFAATAGIFLAIIYFLLNLYIIKRFFERIKVKDTNLFFYVSIFSIWIAIQAQSLISVDTPAISFWGWLFAGFVCSKDNVKLQIKNEISFSKIIASVSTIAFSVLLVFQINAQTEINTNFYIQLPNNDNKYADAKAELLKRAESNEPFNAEWPILSANSLIQDKAYPQTVDAAKRAINLDPKDYRAWYFLAIAQEKLKDFDAAIFSRQQAYKLDPYNTSNLVELGRDYIVLGKVEEARKIIDIIKRFAPNSSDLQIAKSEFN